MKQTVTYIIRHRDMPIYITNKPTDNNSDISYSTNRNRAREFNGMEEASINMDYHKAIPPILVTGWLFFMLYYK
ncbi:phage protein [Staphylococcus aureus]|nr:phage protein [Staphylococcus aureus]